MSGDNIIGLCSCLKVPSLREDTEKVTFVNQGVSDAINQIWLDVGFEAPRTVNRPVLKPKLHAGVHRNPPVSRKNIPVSD